MDSRILQEGSHPLTLVPYDHFTVFNQPMLMYLVVVTESHSFTQTSELVWKIGGQLRLPPTSSNMNRVLANAPIALAFGIRKSGMGFEGKQCVNRTNFLS